MRRRQEAERVDHVAAERVPPAAPVPLLQLATQLGNRAFGALLRQAAAPAEATKTDAGTAPADPTAEAKALIAETPSNDVAYAAWLLKAADQGFADLWKDTRAELEAFRDGKAADGVEPSSTEVKARALITMYDVVKGPMSRWVAEPAKPKQPVTLGSFLRGSTGLHAGPAIDIPRSMEAGTAAQVVTMLADLSVGSYGIGMPFSGDYFDPADEIEAKKTAAQAAAAKDAAPAPVTGAIQLDASHIYKVDWDAEKKAWGEPAIEKAGQAYTLLKSQALKDQLQAMRKAGSTLVIFPDRRGHVHLDQR